MKYDIILIDLDETIFDFKMAEEMALGKTIKAFGLEPTEEVISRYHVINRGLWRQLEEGTVTHQQVLEDRFGNLFAAFGKAVEAAGLWVGGTGAKVRPVVCCKGSVCVHGLVNTQGLA